MITSGKHLSVLGINHGRRQYPGGKERVYTQYIVINMWVPCQVSCVLSHKYNTAPNHSFPVSSKTKVRAFILCAFKLSATKLQCLWTLPTISWLLQNDILIKKTFEPFVTTRFGVTRHRTVLFRILPCITTSYSPTLMLITGLTWSFSPGYWLGSTAAWLLFINCILITRRAAFSNLHVSYVPKCLWMAPWSITISPKVMK